MAITIEEFAPHNLHDLHRCDNAFTVEAKLILHVENDVARYTQVSVPPYIKHYPPSESITYDEYFVQRDKGIFFAYVDGQLAGQIILFKNWNGYAYINDIAVDPPFRKQGVGRALLQHAISWAKTHHLPGIMLETQNINVGACRFYERCGFVLGGFDRLLYRGLHPATEEVALYWYLIF